MESLSPTTERNQEAAATKHRDISGGLGELILGGRGADLDLVRALLPRTHPKAERKTAALPKGEKRKPNANEPPRTKFVTVLGWTWGMGEL